MSTEHLKPFGRSKETVNAVRRHERKVKNFKKWKAEEAKMRKFTTEYLLKLKED